MRDNSRPGAGLAWLVARPIAHRGLHDRSNGIIENSSSAFAAATARGYAMECDVQRTLDGEAVVFHDFTLDRLTSGSGRVQDVSTSDLARLELSGSTAGDHVRPLTHLLDLVQGRCPIVIEIKSRFDGDLRLTHRVADILSGRSDPVAIKSFDPRVVAALKEILPERPRGIVAMAAYDYPDYAALSPDEKRAMASLAHFDDTQPDFISWNVKDLPHAGPYLCRTQLGLPVMAWTVRTVEDVARARSHADQMVFETFLPE